MQRGKKCTGLRQTLSCLGTGRGFAIEKGKRGLGTTSINVTCLICVIILHYYESGSNKSA